MVQPCVSNLNVITVSWDNLLHYWCMQRPHILDSAFISVMTVVEFHIVGMYEMAYLVAKATEKFSKF